MKTLKETIEFINSVKTSKKISTTLKIIKKELFFYTSSFNDLKLTERAYFIFNELNELPTCKICKDKVKFISFEKGYSKFCSASCEKSFLKNSGEVVDKNTLIKTLSTIYLKIVGSEYDTFLKKNNLLASLVFHTSFLDFNVKNTERIYCLMNDITEIPICKHCKIHHTKYKNFSIGYTDYCSVKCSSNSQDKKESIKVTNIEKYGHENTFQSAIGKEKRINYLNNSELLEKSIKKGKDTKIKNHGEDVFIKIGKKSIETKFNTIINGENIIQIATKKCVETKLLKYGSIFPNREKSIKKQKNKFILNKIEILKKKNIIPLFPIDDYKDVTHKYKWKCTICSTVFDKSMDNGILPECPKCNKNNGTSSGEIALQTFLINLTEIETRNKKLLFPFELDILVEDKKIAIEYNGLYFHSLEMLLKKHPKYTYQDAINYHLNKTNKAKEAGINLIHIFEHEWLFKEEIVKSIIENKLGLTKINIGARDCYIKEVPNSDSENFLENNHIQGKDTAKIRIGLYLKKDIKGIEKDTLVSLMTFKKPRYNHLAQYEIKRFCSLLHTNVVGAASKLLKYFEETYKPNSLLSYADKRFSFNSVYGSLGFEYIGDTKPNYFYFKNYNTYSRDFFMKHKIKEFYEKGVLISFFDENLTEQENMQLNGFKRIYDCGNKIFLKKY